jgi:trigger factor
MHHTEEIKSQALEKHIKIMIPANDIEQKFQNEILEIKSVARIDGFRPGKVPESFVLMKFGDSTYDRIASDMIEDSIKEVVKDFNLAGTPRIENLEKGKGQDVSFVLKLELYPEIILPNFADIEIEKPTFEVVEADIKDEIAELIEKATKYEEKSDKAEIKDAVIIDIRGKTSDDIDFPIKEIKNSLFRLDKDKFFSQSFNDQVIGKSAGDEITISIDYPQDFDSPIIAGKKVDYKVKIHSVQSIIVPELNDDFAKSVGYENLDMLKQDMIKDITLGYEDQVYTLLSMRLFDKLETMLEFDIPNSMLEQEIQSIIKELKNISADDESLQGKTEEELRQYAQNFAQRRIRIGMMLSEYAKSRKVQVNNSDIQKIVLKRVKMFPEHMQQGLLDWYYKDQKNLSALSGQAFEQKVVGYILDNEVKITLKNYTLKELLSLIDKETDRKIF